MHTPGNKDWKLLCEAPNELDAVFIKGRLESAGVPVYVASESVAQLYGITQGRLARAKIFVPASKLEEARRILSDDVALDETMIPAAEDETDGVEPTKRDEEKDEPSDA